MDSIDFTLTDHRGQPFSISAWRGSYVVLYFYPKDFTSGCTKQAQAFRDAFCDLQKLNAKVVGVSKDSVESHAKFSAKHDLPFPLLSDPELEIIKQFGAYGTKNMYGKKVEGVIRTTILVDPEGHVVETWRKVRVKGHVDKVIEAIEVHAHQ